MVSAPPLKTRGPGKMGFKMRGEIFIFCKIRGDCPLRGQKFCAAEFKGEQIPGPTTVIDFLYTSLRTDPTYNVSIKPYPWSS